jgi:hypothetical protein
MPVAIHKDSRANFFHCSPDYQIPRPSIPQSGQIKSGRITIETMYGYWREGREEILVNYMAP